MLDYLPETADFPASLAATKEMDPPDRWDAVVRLAGHKLDFLQTMNLDKVLRGALTKDDDGGPLPIRLAVFSSATIEHLLPGLRVAGARHGLKIKTYTPNYGQALQELADPGSELHGFRPNVVLIAYTAEHLLGTTGIPIGDEDVAQRRVSALNQLRMIRAMARNAFGCTIIQQAVLPLASALVGSNEHCLPGSPRRMIEAINETLREEAMKESFDILSLDRNLADDGLAAWHDVALWHRAKQEVSPLASPAYGELAMRLVVAQKGRSRKCLVLDLDNTLWGGVIGDDGLDGIKLGQGSAVGESFSAFQRYVRDLSRRGVILAVCSKNDEKNALGPFESHPEMVLKREDIACFVANWQDKASNLRHIAKTLNIGIDSLVFVDDNPFERNQVRGELPMVAVPELPADPAYYPSRLASAGYFEAVAITGDDLVRAKQYQDNSERERLKSETGDIGAYLKSLDMVLEWAPIDEVSLSRATQLINKTNQFNLTTRRYSAQDVQGYADDPGAIALQMRLLDRFGDNGIIAIVIAKPDGAETLRIDSWLMSCRVLGRGVEAATLSILADSAKALGVKRLIGEYIQTEKNGMVTEHYQKLGFAPVHISSGETGGHTLWSLAFEGYVTPDCFIEIKRV